MDSDASIQINGKIAEIIPTVDQQSRQATLKIALPQGDRLKPGMLLRAQIVINQSTGFTIPTDAVIPSDGELATVFRLNPDNTVLATEVKLGKLLGNNQIEILSGLNKGDRLIIDGAAYVKNGDLVEVVNPI